MDKWNKLIEKIDEYENNVKNHNIDMPYTWALYAIAIMHKFIFDVEMEAIASIADLSKEQSDKILEEYKRQAEEMGWSL